MHALRYPNYRRYFVGQAISMIGTSAQQIALAWLVYRLTGSAVLLGVTAFASQAPQLVIAPLAGVLIDRADRRRFLLGVQWLLVAQALALAWLAWSGRITPALLIGMSVLLGVLNSFDAPGRQALATQLVDDPRALPSAIALNSVIFNIGRFVGPPAAGLLLAATSEAMCFLVNALSFLALIASLWRLQLAPTVRAKSAQPASLTDGVRYARGSAPVRTLLTLVSLHNLTIASYVVVMPAVTLALFGNDPTVLGVLLGAAGLGSLAAAGMLALQRGVKRMPAIGTVSAVVSALALAALSLVDRQPVAWVLLFIVGFGMTGTNITSNTLLQTLIDDNYRGRVMSLYTASLFGMAAVGGLIIGVVADLLTPTQALAVEGLAFTLAFVWLLPKLRALSRRVRAGSPQGQAG